MVATRDGVPHGAACAPYENPERVRLTNATLCSGNRNDGYNDCRKALLAASVFVHAAAEIAIELLM